MRRFALAAVAALSLSALPAAESAPVTPGFATPNVEWIANVPLHADSAGARIVGKYLYASDSRALTIYDISDPELPVPVGATPIPQVPYVPQEDLETNGKVLVLGQDTGPGVLFVFDVSVKPAPRLLTAYRGASSHTITCVLDCRYLYNSNGQIVDLREPATPKVVGDWTGGRNFKTGAHDLTEVRPGLVLASSNPLVYLDARRNPAKPKVIATSKGLDGRFVHGNLWPNAGTDRWILAGGETGGGDCGDETAGAFMTFDAKTWRMVDEFRPASSQNPAEGGAVASTWCTHWFSTRPGYRNGGIVAMGWYERGTRFLRVSSKGRIEEVGWFLPAGTSASAAYWVSKDLVYVFDYQRGLDIVRFSDKPVPRRAPGRGLAPTQAPLFAKALRPSFGMVCPVPE